MILRVKKKILIILGLLAAIGVVGFFLMNRNAPKKVATAKVLRGDLQTELTISGKVDANEQAALRFQTSGYLTWVGVKEGDYVKKYQTLASLDRDQVQKTMQKYLAAYTKDRNSFDQGQDDYKDKIFTDEIKRTLSDNQMDLNSAVLDVEIANLAVKYSSLWTPIEGIVVHIENPNAGVNVTPSSSEIDVVNPKSVYFSALADQTEVTQIAEGKEGDLVLDSYPDKKFFGRVDKISFTPKTGETGTVYEVKFNFDGSNDLSQYKMGMTGDLTFVTDKKTGVLYLPNKFVKSSGGKKYVLVNKEKVYVETGMETDNAIEIVSGLSEGQTVSE